jgi:ribonuclease VapC
VVVDTSIVLAVFFDEEGGSWAAGQLAEHAASLRMSTVNLAEALIRVRDRQPTLADELEDRLITSGIRFIPPDVAQAKVAARARLRFPLNLGDCFAYALSVAEDCPILTVDRDFRRVDRPVLLP